ncbi:MAG: rhomboid family intramembrane serine protease [Myxococcota bacterium]
MELPNGAEMIASMGRRQSVAGRAMATQPLATHALLGLLIVFYANQQLLGAFDGPFDIIRWGANSAPLVWDGEYFRLLSGNFLHAHLLHILLNGIALLSLGGVLERLIGWHRFVLIYLLSGLAATTASAAVGTIMSVGASGAIFGLLGGFAVLNWRHRAHLPLGFRQPLRWWFFILGINALLPALVPQIDVTAHFVGFLVGALVAWFILEPAGDFQSEATAGPGLRALTLGVASVFAVGLITSVWYTAKSGDDTTVAFARRVAAMPEAPPELLNAAAWEFALNADSEPKDLRLAKDAAQRALQISEGAAQIRDTLSTLDYRLGDFDAAVREQREILEHPPQTTVAWWIVASEDLTIYASQLRRFLIARQSQSGPMIAPEFEPSQLHLSSQEGRITVDLLQVSDQGLIAYALITSGSRAGLLQIVALPHASGVQQIELDPQVLPITPKTTFDIVLMQPNATGLQIDGNLRAWPMNQVVAEYP